MSTPSSGPGGVKNLRALFEVKNGERSISPSSRGRSPSESEPLTRSRPVSRVRATFVPVERGGEAGVPPVPKLDRKGTMDSLTGNSKVNGLSHTSEELGTGGLGVILKGSAFELSPKKAVRQESEVKQVTPLVFPKEEPANNKKINTNVKSPQVAREPTKTVKSPTTANTKYKAIRSPSTQTAAQNPSSQLITKSPTLNKLTSASTKSPSVPASQRAKGGVAKIAGILESSKQAEKERQATQNAEAQPHKESEIKSRSVVEQKPDVSTAGAKNMKTVSKPKVNGVKKTDVSTMAEAPKSPNQQAKLPSAATATTAASTARAEQTAQDADLDAAKKTTKRVSNASSRPPRVATATTASSLAKKASTTSLVGSQYGRPKSRVSMTGGAEESFLARMTRPTASSAQKAHDKAKIDSPPRTRSTVSSATSGAGAVGSVRSRHGPSTKSHTEGAGTLTNKMRQTARSTAKSSTKSAAATEGEDKENTPDGTGAGSEEKRNPPALPPRIPSDDGLKEALTNDTTVTEAEQNSNTIQQAGLVDSTAH